MDYYKNKHVYITGGSSGIGLDLARRLFSYGANLIIIARNSAKLEDARRDIELFRVSSGQLKPEFVAAHVLRAVVRKKFMVVPGFRAKWLWYTQRLTPALFRFSSDMIIKWGLRRK